MSLCEFPREVVEMHITSLKKSQWTLWNTVLLTRQGIKVCLAFSEGHIQLEVVKYSFKFYMCYPVYAHTVDPYT